MPGILGSGIRIAVGPSSRLKPVELPPLAGFNPATFAFDIGAPFVQGVKTGQSLLAPIADAIEYQSPEAVAERDFREKARALQELQLQTEMEMLPTKTALAKQDAEMKIVLNKLQQNALAGVLPSTAGKPLAPKVKEEDLEKFFTENFNTQLTPEEEAAFIEWAKERSKAQGRDVLMDLGSYDMRGLFKEGVLGGNKELYDEATGHSSDKFKKPFHPTFSNESIYSTGEYEGGKWADNSFTPGATNLKYYSPERLQEAFNQQQRGTDGTAKLILPEVKNQIPTQKIHRIDPFKGLVEEINPEYKLWEEKESLKRKTDADLREKAAAKGMVDFETASKEEIVKFLGKSEGGKTLPKEAVETLSSAKTAFDDLKALREAFKQDPQRSGSAIIEGGAIDRFFSPYKTQSLNSKIDKTTQIVGKYLEGGKMTNEDFLRYKEKVFPALENADSVAESKFNDLQETLMRKYATDLEGFKNAGYDVSEYENTDFFSEAPKKTQAGVGGVKTADQFFKKFN